MSKQGWRHAFAVDPPGPAEPTPEQQFAVDWLCTQVVKRHLTTPGVLGLEMFRPLNYFGANLVGHVFAPAIWAIFRESTYENYKHFVGFLEHRGSMEYLEHRLEHFEEEFARLEKEGDSVRDYITAHFDALRRAQAETPTHDEDHPSDQGDA